MNGAGRVYDFIAKLEINEIPDWSKNTLEWFLWFFKFIFISRKMIRVLSLPSGHPYMSKFHESGAIKFVNPNTDYFDEIYGLVSPDFVDKKHEPSTYDLVHTHFSFDMPKTQLYELLKYFKKRNKPVVWTCHGRTNQRKKDISEDKELQKILFNNADGIITLTEGCREWLIQKFGNSKNIEVIPHGYILNPEELKEYTNYLKDKKNENFVYLVGDFRANKEVRDSVQGFLNHPKLKSCKLTIIHHTPINDDKDREFIDSIKNSERIKIISGPEISNEVLNAVFCKSRACILPYLWGTHSGQIELSKDCGCYPIISNVGFYSEQSNQAVIFEHGSSREEFIKNFLNACVEISQDNEGVAVRSSQNPKKTVHFSHDEWAVFVKGVKNSEFD